MDKNKREEVCLECGITIKGHTFNSFNHSFCNHLRKEHSMKHGDYIVKYEHNGISPKCHCGCGNEVKWSKGVFLKYFSDHKNHMKLTQEQKEKIKKSTAKNKNIELSLSKMGLSIKKLEESYESFCNQEKSMGDISRQYGIDKRTLKIYWYDAGIIKDKNVFARMARKSQGLWKYKIIQPSFEESEKLELLWPDIISFFTTSKTKRTLTEVIRIFDLKIGYNYLFDRVQEKMGLDFIKDYIHLCSQSKIELEFYNILKFYFPHSIKKQFKLEGRFFDYILGDKILIELDGDYWHSKSKNKENDERKNQSARDCGYILLRIQEKEVKNIDVLVKIKELYENIQTSKNRKD